MHRFFSKTKLAPSGCLEWQAATDAGGYGRFMFEAVNCHAHRIAWVLANGEIPAGLHVLHTCDNPKCVNTEHLFLGTQSDNVADMNAKGRHANFNGVANPNVKLTEQDVRDIRTSHLPTQRLADKYGLTYQGVWRIRRYLTWRNVR